MFGALKRSRFRSLASLSYTCKECCWRTSTEKNTCGIARFPCGSTAFLLCIGYVFNVVAQLETSAICTKLGRGPVTTMCTESETQDNLATGKNWREMLVHIVDGITNG